MDPPGKRSGFTTNESVLNASRSPDGSASTAASPSAVGSVPANASTNTASIRAADALPPAPWASVMTSSSKRGRRRRKASMRSRTRPLVAVGRAPLPIMVRPVDWMRSQSSKLIMACASWIRCTLSDAHHEAVVDVGAGRERATLVAGQSDREQSGPLGLGEGHEDVAGVAARRDPERDVGRAGVGDELAGEHEVEADVVRQRGQHGRVGGEAARRERPSDRRLREERCAPWRRRSSSRRSRT